MRAILAATAAVLLGTTMVHAQGVSDQANSIVESIGGACDVFDYEEDCFRAWENGVKGVAEMSDADKEAVYAKIRAYAERRPQWADEVAALFEKYSVPATAPM